jgi:hypothetical protein
LRRPFVKLQPGQWLACAAAVVGLLGALHLLYTFHGKKLKPRDTHLERQMELVAPEISRNTTMWLAWIGFNASHAMGALLFALVFGWFGLAQPQLFFHSPFLVVVGFAMLAGWVLLAKEYWFRIPLGGLVLALALYCWAVLAAWMA